MESVVLHLYPTSSSPYIEPCVKVKSVIASHECILSTADSLAERAGFRCSGLLLSWSYRPTHMQSLRDCAMSGQSPRRFCTNCRPSWLWPMDVNHECICQQRSCYPSYRAGRSKQRGAPRLPIYGIPNVSRGRGQIADFRGPLVFECSICALHVRLEPSDYLAVRSVMTRNAQICKSCPASPPLQGRPPKQTSS